MPNLTDAQRIMNLGNALTDERREHQETKDDRARLEARVAELEAALTFKPTHRHGDEGLADEETAARIISDRIRALKEAEDAR